MMVGVPNFLRDRRCFAQKLTLSPALQVQHLPRFVRRCDFQRELVKHARYLDNLIRITSRKLASFDIQAVLKPHADVSSHKSRLCCHRHLMAARSKNGPDVVSTEKTVRGTSHEYNVVRLRPNSAQDAEHTLNKEGGLTSPLSRKYARLYRCPMS